MDAPELHAPSWADYQHGVWLPCLEIVALWISLSLMIRIWLLHTGVGTLRRILWSFIVLLPVLVWVFYAAFFHMPEASDTLCPTENSAPVIPQGHGIL